MPKSMDWLARSKRVAKTVAYKNSTIEFPQDELYNIALSEYQKIMQYYRRTGGASFETYAYKVMEKAVYRYKASFTTKRTIKADPKDGYYTPDFVEQIEPAKTPAELYQELWCIAVDPSLFNDTERWILKERLLAKNPLSLKQLCKSRRICQKRFEFMEKNAVKKLVSVMREKNPDYQTSVL